MRCGEDPHVDLDPRLAADAPEGALLEHAEQGGLHPGRELADLVEEERPAVGLLEEAALPRRGAGEGAGLVAEELAREDALGEDAAALGDEGPARAIAAVVDGAGDELLAGPGLAEDEHGHVGRGDAGDARREEAHGLALAHERGRAGAGLGAEADDLGAERAHLGEPSMSSRTSRTARGCGSGTNAAGITWSSRAGRMPACARMTKSVCACGVPAERRTSSLQASLGKRRFTSFTSGASARKSFA